MLEHLRLRRSTSKREEHRRAQVCSKLFRMPPSGAAAAAIAAAIAAAAVAAAAVAAAAIAAAAIAAAALLWYVLFGFWY